MAYYGSVFSEGDVGEYYRNPYYYSSNYDNVPSFQDSSSFSYSNYEFTEPESIDYFPCDNYVNYDHPFDYPCNNSMETRLFEYNPSPYQTGYHVYPSTEFRISYSVSQFHEDPKSVDHQFNVPEFDEYDPTPYDGGFDIVLTYGKPLPPSDEICYPRSTSEHKKGVAIGDGSKPATPAAAEEEHRKPAAEEGHRKPIEHINGDVGIGHGVAAKDHKMPLDLEIDQIEEKKGNELQEVVVDDDDDVEKGRGLGDYGYDYGCGYDVKVVETPPGYGLEAMDICESLFGYWPCLFKKERNNINGGQQVGDGDNQWSGAADYLFGTSNCYYGGGGSYITYTS